MKIKFSSLLLALVLLAGHAAAQIDHKDRFTFFMANDLGRNGYYDQKPIAATMGRMAEEIGPEFIVATGDIHHFEGVRSTEDPLWMTNFELIYDHPELMIPWYAIAGNHEYRNNVQACIDYTQKSARWNMPARYYTKAFDEEGTTVRIVWIDTTPLIDKYRNDKEDYPQAGLQDMDRQLQWLDSVLTAAKEDWVLVFGHHPIYADTDKNDSERTDMQQRVGSILKRHNVDFYGCGHIHNFQYIKRADGGNIDYLVNTSGSLSRQVKPTEGTQYCSSEPGFSVFAINAQDMKVYLVDRNGEVLYTITRTQQ